ncbi:MAG TPA: transposase [Haliangiales bacterium]|nr:transposase [Haliangiales bacterium]
MTKTERGGKPKAPSGKSGWGGWRPGSGRKPTGAYGYDRRGRPLAGVSHHARPVVDPRHPLHVVLRTTTEAPRLRAALLTGEMRKLLERRAGRDVECRVVQFSIRRNEIHFILQAPDRDALSRAVQGLASGFARRINRLTGGNGRLWLDRYDARPLKTPREMRACVEEFFEPAG